jgi:hypothetical protein
MADARRRVLGKDFLPNTTFAELQKETGSLEGRMTVLT